MDNEIKTDSDIKLGDCFRFKDDCDVLVKVTDVDPEWIEMVKIDVDNKFHCHAISDCDILAKYDRIDASEFEKQAAITLAMITRALTA